MKILLVPEYASFGGTRSFFFKLLGIHQKNGFDTGVVLEQKQLETGIVEKLRGDGIPVYQVKDRSKLASNPFLSWWFDIRKLIKAFRSYRPDLIVVSNGTPGIMLGALIFPPPVLFIMHTYPDKYPWPIRSLWRMFCGSSKNQLVTVSEYAADKIRMNMGVPRDRIRVIHNSFTLRVPNLQDSPSRVLTLGHVVGYKNPEAWLQVAMKVLQERPGTQFIWLGDGALLQQMRNKVKQHELDGCVSFEGYQEDVVRFFTQATVYFQPSLIENHAISVLDAMASGLPCVASNVGGTPESIVDQETGFLCAPDDVADYSRRLIQLLDDSILAKRMGTAGQARAERLFAPYIQESVFLELYQNLAGCDQSSGR